MARISRIAIPAVSLLMLLPALSACAGDDDEGATGGNETAASGDCDKVDKVKIGFPGLPPDFVQMSLPIADERGVLAAYCIDADFIEVESGVAAFRAMAAGQFEFSYSGSVSPVLAKAEGADATVFMSGANQLDMQVVGLADYTTCESLKGQSVATDGPGGLIHAVMEEYLTSCGLDIDTDVKVQIGDPETFGQQLVAGTVVATTTHVDEAIFMQDELGLKLNILGNAWEFAPLFHYSSLSTATSRLTEEADLYTRISAAILESNRWLKDPANLDAATALMAKVSDQPEDVVTKAIDSYGLRFPTTCDEAMDPEAFQFLIDQQVSVGALEESYPAEDLIDPTVCHAGEKLLEQREADGETVK